MFLELADDLARQTIPFKWLVAADLHAEGPSILRNRLVDMATTEWVAFVDDDDRVYPEHLATLLENSDDADVVYTLCDVEGRDWLPAHDCELVGIEAANSVPITALVRRSMFLDVGGFPPGVRDEDWALWLALKRVGARFECVHETTWLYRFHNIGRGNRTWWS